MIRKIQAQKAITSGRHYAVVPNELFERKDLTVQAKLIWSYLMSQDPNWASSRNNIARNLQIHPSIVSKAIKTLEKLKMLRVDRIHRRLWHFDLIEPGLWENPDSKRIHRIKSDPIKTLSDQIGSDIGSKVIHTQEDKKKNKNGSEPSFGAPDPDPYRSPLDWGHRTGPGVVKSKEEKEELDGRLAATIERIQRDMGVLNVSTA